MYKILFVCWGNICRSPTAHFVMQAMLNKHTNKSLQNEVYLDSCGMYGEPEGTPTHPQSVAMIKKRLGCTLQKKSRHWRRSDYNDFDLILAMDSDNYSDIMREIGQDTQKKVYMFRYFDPEASRKGEDVPDPYYCGGFDKVFNIIERTCTNMIKAIEENGKVV